MTTPWNPNATDQDYLAAIRDMHEVTDAECARAGHQAMLLTLNGAWFAVGDKVAYSIQFLKSIGMSHSEMAHARGVITALTPFGGKGNALASIEWDREMPGKVLTSNLAKVGLNREFSNVG